MFVPVPVCPLVPVVSNVKVLAPKEGATILGRLSQRVMIVSPATMYLLFEKYK